MWHRRPGRYVLPLALAGGVLSCGKGREAATQAAGAPVVLVSIDTLRADRLPAYGYPGVETPHLDALRRDAVLFANAYSHVPLTLPAHVSMLTGLLPPEHGVRDNIGYTFGAADKPRLAELLKARGYATGAAVSSYVLRAATGLRPGFDVYDEVPSVPTREGAAVAEAQRPAAATLPAALAWLDQVRSRPFFLFLHLYDPHTPYEPPEPLRARYGATYEAEIAAADAALGPLLASLRRDGLYDRALIIVTSDHGEGLGDHGEEEHGILLYREALHVPLLLKLPGAVRAGSTETAPAALVDLVPTVLAAAGVEAPAGLSGRDLLRPAASPVRVASETYYPRIHLGWSELRSVVDERYHYIDGPRPELYDVKADPAEHVDLVAREPAVARALKAEIERQQTRFAGPAPADDQTRQRLASLGYLSGGAVPVRPGEALPNPRDHIQVRAQLKDAFALARRGDDARAAAALQRVLAENPRLFDARVELAGCLARLGRHDEALDAYAEAARTSPELAETIALSRARLQLELGRFDDAAREAQAAARVEPGWAHEVRARVALARGDLDAAEKEARAAERDAAAGPAAAVVLAQVQASRGDLAGALALADRVAARPGGVAVPGLQFVRGDTLARLGRHAEAESALRAEITAFPRNTRAYASLAIVRALQGAPVSDSREIVERMHRARSGASTALLAAKTLDFIGDADGAAAWRRRAGPAKAPAGGSS